MHHAGFTMLIVAVLAQLTLSFPAQAQQDAVLPESSVAVTRLRNELDELISWLPGDFDNHEQVHFQTILDIPPEGWNLQLHHLYRRVEAPLLGDDVFFVHVTVVGSDVDVLAPSFASFTLDTAADAVRQSNYRIVDPLTLVGSDYADLSWEDVEPQPSCHVLWRSQGGKIVGLLENSELCQYRSAITGGRWVSRRDRFVLEQDRIWSQFRWTDPMGKLVFGNAMNLPLEARRAEWFQCEVNLKHATSGRTYLERVRVHNQGGTARVMATDAALDVGFIKLRRVIWPGESEALEIALSWHEGSSSQPAAFTLRHPDAKQISISHREIDIYCDVPAERPGAGS